MNSGGARRAAGSWQRAAGRAGLLLAAALCSCTCERIAGPEGEIARQLRAAELAGATVQVPGRGALVVRRLRFDRLLVKPEGDGYVAVCTVDAEGRFADRTRVSYLGLERIPFTVAPGRVAPAGPLLPTLAALVEVLEARRDAWNRYDLAAAETLVARSWNEPGRSRERVLEDLRDALVRMQAHPKEPTPDAWIIRAEREWVEALEESPPSQGYVPRKRHRLVREDGAFRFVSGLM